MKSIVKILLMAIFIAGTANIAQAQEEAKEPKEKTIKIQTSAICGMCEDRIESNIAYEKGVKSVELDDETKIVTITYKTAKTNPDKLGKAISKLGYDADDVEADKEAHDKLPKCCQKGTTPH